MGRIILDSVPEQIGLDDHVQVDHDVWTKRWQMIRQLHKLSRPGAVRDVKWKSKALVTLQDWRIDQDKFKALMTSLLGLGTLSSGAIKVAPVVSKLFRVMELQPIDDSKIDLREVIGMLYIVEFGVEYDKRPLKLVSLLFDLFDPRAYEYITRNGFRKMLLLFASSRKWADGLHGLCDAVLDFTQTVKMTWTLFENYLKEHDPEWEVEASFQAAIQACLPKESKFAIEYRDQSVLMNKARKRTRLVLTRVCVHKMQWHKAAACFDQWANFTKSHIRKRLSKQFGERMFRQKRLLFGIRKLRWFAIVHVDWERRKKLVRIYHETVLLRRCFNRFKAMHQYHEPGRLVRESEFRLKLEKALRILEGTLERGLQRRRWNRREYCFWTMKNIFGKIMAKETKAHAFWKRNILRKVWATFQSEVQAGRKERRLEQEEHERKTFLQDLFQDVYTFKEEEKRRETEEMARRTRIERQTKKYEKLRFSNVAEKIERKRLDFKAVEIQMEGRQQKKEAIMKQHKEAVEQYFKDLLVHARSVAKEYIQDTKEGAQKIAEGSKMISRFLKIYGENRHSELLEKFGGHIDFMEALPIFDDRLCLQPVTHERGKTIEVVYHANRNVKFIGSKIPDEEENDDDDDKEENLSERDLEAELDDEEENERKENEEEEESEDELVDDEMLAKIVHRIEARGEKVRQREAKKKERFYTKKDLTKKLISERLVEWQLIEGFIQEQMPDLELNLENYEQNLLEERAARTIQEFYFGLQRKRQMRLDVQRARNERDNRAAVVIQCFWRERKSWAIALERLKSIVIPRIDPASGNPYYMNLPQGQTTWDPPTLLQRRHRDDLLLQEELGRRPWVLRFDENMETFYYLEKATGTTSIGFPLGFEQCDVCKRDFADRRCLDCRSVKNGNLFVPKYCMSCWGSDGHYTHAFEATKM